MKQVYEWLVNLRLKICVKLWNMYSRHLSLWSLNLGVPQIKYDYSGSFDCSLSGGGGSTSTPALGDMRVLSEAWSICASSFCASAMSDGCLDICWNWRKCAAA